MKLAYTVCTSDLKNKYLAYQADMNEMLSSLEETGYQGIEVFVCDPKAVDQGAFLKALEKNSLELVAVGTGPIASEAGLTFTSVDESVRREAIKRTKDAIDFASRGGSQVNIGKMRGNIYQTEDDQKMLAWRNEAFKEINEYAQRKNVFVTLEPQCRFAVDNLNSTQEALAWIKEQQFSNIFLMVDTFHMNIEDKSITASLIEARDYILHIHFADNNRGVPGTGSIDFVETIRVLKALGYERFISMEINQTPDCYTAAKRSFEYVNRLIKENS